MEQNLHVDCIYFDFSKAFDRVSIPKLLFKLRYYNFPNNLCKWIENWLSGRQFATRCDNSYSALYDVTSGVPQGSVLGPILFNIFTSDLAYELRLHGIRFQLYADDVKVYHSYSNSEGHSFIQQAIDIVTSWAEKWQLPLAPEKCQALYLGTGNTKADYYCDNVLVSKVNKVKDLGFLINERLDFTDHVQSLCIKARRRAFCLLRGIKTCNKKTLLLCYKLYIRSIVESASTVFNSIKVSEIRFLEGIQNMFTKRIYMRSHNMKFFETPSAPTRNKELSLETLETRRGKADMKMMKKILGGKTVIPHSEFYKVNKSRTRGAKVKVAMVFAKKQIRRTSFAFRTTVSGRNLNFNIV